MLNRLICAAKRARRGPPWGVDVTDLAVVYLEADDLGAADVLWTSPSQGEDAEAAEATGYRRILRDQELRRSLPFGVESALDLTSR